MTGKENELFGCVFENVPDGRAAPDGSTANVWCRSVNSSNSNNFCLVNTDGSANNNNANNSYGVAPGFRIAEKAGSNAVTGVNQTHAKGKTLPRQKPKTANREPCADAACMAGLLC